MEKNTKHLKLFTIIAAIAVLITGSLAHFVYGWTGKNHIVGFFTPVSESVWEHMKLLFFPMLICSLFMVLRFRAEYPCIVSAFSFGTLSGTWLIPAFYYAYTSVLGKNSFVLDIGTFILSVLIAFLLSYRLTLSCRLKPYTFLLCALMCILFTCFVLFTYQPPEHQIFQDPTQQQSNGISAASDIAKHETWAQETEKTLVRQRQIRVGIRKS